jgi:predicted NAD/FAD-dependent oxidoreductase
VIDWRTGPLAEVYFGLAEGERWEGPGGLVRLVSKVGFTVTRDGQVDRVFSPIKGSADALSLAARRQRCSGMPLRYFSMASPRHQRRRGRHQAGFRFDHGAQFFSPTDERFARWARAWWLERCLTEWEPRVTHLGGQRAPEPSEPARVVAMPGMASLVERMLVDLDVRRATEARDGSRWRLRSSSGEALGEFDALIVTAPAPQAAALLETSAFAFAARLRDVKMAARHALLAAFDDSLGLDYEAATSSVGPLAWLARDSQKPERVATPGERWVFHTTTDWSRKHLEEAPERVAAQLLEAVFATTGAARVEPRFFVSHRWRYAEAQRPLGEDCLFDEALQLAACGDWARGGGIEAAFLSGVAAAARLTSLPGPPAPLDDVPTRRHPAQLKLLD